MGNLDNFVKQYIVQLRAARGIINVDVVMAGLESNNRAVLAEYGESIIIEAARSLLTRMNFVKCKVSTAPKNNTHHRV